MNKLKTLALAAVVTLPSLAFAQSAPVIDIQPIEDALNSIIPLVTAIGQILLIIWATKKAIAMIRM